MGRLRRRWGPEEAGELGGGGGSCHQDEGQTVPFGVWGRRRQESGARMAEKEHGLLLSTGKALGK